MKSEGRSFTGLKIPIITGILVAIVKTGLSVIQFDHLDNYRTSSLIFIISLSFGILMLLTVGILQKKRLGADANVKSIFRAIFITILIGISVSFAYEQIRLVSDPALSDRIYNTKVAHAKTMLHATERLAELKTEYEKSKNVGIPVSDILTQLLSYIVWYSILGFIFALIIGGTKPKNNYA